jgi:hypothetical protein
MRDGGAAILPRSREQDMAIWNCTSCGEDNDSEFGICWNCGLPSDGGVTDPAFAGEDALVVDDETPAVRELACTRCGAPMQALGRLRLHESSLTLPVIHGPLGERVIDRQSFDAYTCTRPDCGKVEFFTIALTEVSMQE